MSAPRLRKKDIGKILRVLFALVVLVVGYVELQQSQADVTDQTTLPHVTTSDAGVALSRLAVKGRAPKTGYLRTHFSDGWDKVGTCNVRNLILARDLVDVTFVDKTCNVASGVLYDHYTGKTITFVRGADTSDDVQIDHVVALGDAWQKGAQLLTPEQRHLLANDPLNLLAVDGAANQVKGDGDAATWLPANKSFRCEYVARQIAVKQKYTLWVTVSEYKSIATILENCPDQKLPSVTPLGESPALLRTP
jgi:hypothetical protein